MRNQKLFVIWGLLSYAMLPGASQAQAQSEERPARRCEALREADFSLVPDALTQITDTRVERAVGDVPAYCQVNGYVAPSVGFSIRLPSAQWNGKLLELGCGAFCGSTGYINACDEPLRKGYACIVTDGGHRSTIGDGKWAYHNLQSKIDMAYRAPHVTGLAGRAIVEAYYGREAQRKYFMGCSGGGSQAMWMAQRFPWDFDGIVAGAPDIHWTESNMTMLWGNRVLTQHTDTAILTQGDLDILHQAVVARCDHNDGLADGVIGDPRRCDFEPATLQCRAGRTAHCLSAAKIAAVEKIYRGPTSSKGERLFPPYVMKGSERTWLSFFWGAENYPRAVYNFMGEAFRYLSFHPDPGPRWKPEDFDFDRDPQRLGVMETLLEPVNPDLRRLQGAGAKLLAYTGWADPAEGVLRTIDLYENAQKIVGSRAATQEFFRLFVIPGMSHCMGGDGADAIDYLSYLEAWVEKNEAPEKLIGAHLQGEPPENLRFPLDPKEIAFSRPVYPYPIQTRYLGRGDPNAAESFGPGTP
jgi:feruloyl esterase